MNNMIRKIVILLMAVIFMTACQKDELEDNSMKSDAVSVKFSFSTPEAMEGATEYVPMTKAQNENLYQLKISNVYNVIITKKIGSKWIVERILSNKINETASTWAIVWHSIKNETKVKDFAVELTPGQYRATVVTGVRSISWNLGLIPGMIVDDENDSTFEVPEACIYTTIGDHYINTGWYGLEEEIFAGVEDFVVEKTEDLHSSSKIVPVNLKLNRTVTKLRILLDNTPYETGSYKFEDTFSNSIAGRMVTSEPGGFPIGLNVWGEPYYSPTNVTSELRFATFTEKDNEIEAQGVKYLVPIKGDSRQTNIFFFGDPSKEFTVNVSGIEVEFQQNTVTYWAADVFPLKLKNNYMTGFILKCSNNEESRQETSPEGGLVINNYREMHIVYESGTTLKSPVDLFDYNFEYR